MFSLNSVWPLGLSRRNWLYYLLGFVALLLVLTQMDAWASQTAIHWPYAWRAPFLMITDYGLSDWVLYPTLIGLILCRLLMLVLRRLPRLAAYEASLFSAFIFIGVGLPGLVSNLLKRIIGRGRPEVFDAEGIYSFQPIANDWTHQSFPSGHTTTAIALAFAAGFLWPRSFKPLLLIGLLVAFSRIPVGMHYPTDVLGGLALGTLGAYGVRNVFARLGWLFRFAPDGTVVRRPAYAVRRLIFARRHNAPMPPTDRP